MATKGYHEDDLVDYYDEDYEEENGDWEQEDADRETYQFVEKAAKKKSGSPPVAPKVTLTPSLPKLISPKNSFVIQIASGSSSQLSLPQAALAPIPPLGHTSNQVAKLGQLNSAIGANYQVSTWFLEKCSKLPATEAVAAGKEGLDNPNFPREKYITTPHSQTVFVVIGHVDAGKSTLNAQLVKAFGTRDTGISAQHVAVSKSGKCKTRGTNLAWELDVASDEREHGVTIDSKSKSLVIDDRHFVAIDAPGHADYVPSMLLGAMQADAAVLVIDCVKFDSGFSRGGQTKEHVALIRSLGIQQLVVVLNKTDMMDPDARAKELETILCQLDDFIFEEMKFSKKSVKFVPVSAINNDNVSARAAHQQQCLKDALLALSPKNHGPIHHTVCVPIVDVSGDRFSGRIECGSVHAGEKLMILPSRQLVTINAGHGPAAHHTYFPGNYLESVQFSLQDAASGSLSPTWSAFIHPGSVLVDPVYPLERIQVVEKFLARILVINDDYMPVVKGQSVTMNCHTAMIDGFISRLVAHVPQHNSEETAKKPSVPKCLVKGDVGIVELTVRKGGSIVVEPDTNTRVTGRVVIRDRGVTIAVGLVVSA